MATWKLYVENYGKIEKAELEVAPLTLFVGDNNSGKSYLLSLLWGIQNIGARRLFADLDKMESEDVQIVSDWIKQQLSKAREGVTCKASVTEISEQLERLINICLNQKKDELLKWIFNSEDVKIGKLYVTLLCEDTDEFTFKYENVNEEGNGLFQMITKHGEYGIRTDWSDSDEKKSFSFLMIAICATLLGISFMANRREPTVYLPAARTGFMLSKDVINKVGRDNTFNLSEEGEEEITPFTRPINAFLDVMSELSLEKKGQAKNIALASGIENEMAKGNVDISSLPSKEVQYVPKGKNKGMPLRVVSAVVSELSPLILILKHKQFIKTLYYEEPEMCLHPKLQQSMGKLLCRLINIQIGVVATTHSDIILQHINNMIKLSTTENREEICAEFGYGDMDLLSPDKVRVYQLEETNNGTTKVTELPCGRYGFEIPTFNDALDDIMEVAYTIQG